MTAAQPASLDRAPRVLHLIKWLPRGGIETWLSHLFAATDTDAPVRHELLVMKADIGPLEDKVRAAGVQIHVLEMHSKAAWFGKLYRFLKDEGPFEIFHVHLDAILGGPALAAAAAAGVRVRIAHNHAARSMGQDYQELRYKLRHRIGRAVTAAAATRRVAISDMAMEHLAGAGWRGRKDCTILLYGFDYDQFRGAAGRAAALRERLGIPSGATVVGHVGRFDPVKNHGFLLDCFAVYAERDPTAVLVLVGRGALQQEVQARAVGLGLGDKVIFAGGTDDAAAYLAMFDVFVFPSFSEGLGIVILEAQAAGTPVLMPDNMPREVIVAPQSLTELPLAAGAAARAQDMERILRRPPPDPAGALAAVESSIFGMARCRAELERIYLGEIDRAQARGTGR